MTPEITYVHFRLQIELPSLLEKGKTYWSPIGSHEHSLERALTWLRADFDIWKTKPNVKYRVVKETFYDSTIEVVEENNRQTMVNLI